MNSVIPHNSSFRDPSGFIFKYGNKIYRQINLINADDFDAFINSGLYEKLIDEELLLPHKEVNIKKFNCDNAYKIIQPDEIPFISYPYEWSYLQLKAAAKLTLRIQKIALKFGFSLKDASAYNIQFFNGKPIFIDTLSFEKYKGVPWVAYGQFCEHFLASLAIRKFKGRKLSRLSQLFIEGVPLDLTSKMLPVKSWLNFAIIMHIHLHAKMQKKYSDIYHDQNKLASDEHKLSKKKHFALIDSLTSTVESLKVDIGKSEWKDYYASNNYNDLSIQHKKDLVETFIRELDNKQNIIADVGANTGEFTRIAQKYANQVIAFDFDEVVVEINYLQAIKSNEHKILPLVLDIVNPTPSIGWSCNERDSIFDRANFDIVMSLALIHHLAIANNVPLEKIVKTFSSLVKKYWIVEFVPKSDSQVKRLLSTREDIFPYYSQGEFEKQVKSCFVIEKKAQIKQTARTLYLLKKIYS